MNANLDAAVDKVGQQIVDRASDVIAIDAKAVIIGREQFPAPESEVPSTLESVTPYPTFYHPLLGLTTREAVKKLIGLPDPSTPRIGTGALLASIHAEHGDLKAIVDSNSSAADAQQEGAGPWTDELGYKAPANPPRPFMGVSQRAYTEIEAFANNALNRLQSDLENVELETVRLTV